MVGTQWLLRLTRPAMCTRRTWEFKDQMKAISVGAVYEGVNKSAMLNFRHIPLLEKEGWLRHQ